jgi:hypothetical protein
MLSRASYNSLAMLRGDNRTNSANGACGRQERHDSQGMVDRVRGSAGRTAHPQEPLAGLHPKPYTTTNQRQCSKDTVY